MALNDWQDGEAGGTPLSADRLNERDAAIVAAQSAADAAATTAQASAVTATAISPGTATNVQDILAELAARITALESAAG